MGNIDKKLFNAKYGNDPIRYFENLPDVESVKVCQDEIIVNYKRNPFSSQLGGKSWNFRKYQN